MEKDLYELIEAYLDNALPDEKRRAVEERMATDEAFRQEVEIHRDLQESYADPERWHLRTALIKAMEEPLSPEAPPDIQPNVPISEYHNTTTNTPAASWKWWRWWPVVLVLGAGIWYLAMPDKPLEVPQATEKPPVETPEGLPAKEQEAEPPIEKPKEIRPIAMADPANFKENPSMEALIISGIRDGEVLTVNITRPKIGARFKPRPSGKTGLRFSGAIEGLSDTTDFKVHLLIFNSKNVNTPVLTQPLPLRLDAKGKPTFDLALQVDFTQGLYYFRIEEDGGSVLRTSKFFLGSLSGK